MSSPLNQLRDSFITEIDLLLERCLAVEGLLNMGCVFARGHAEKNAEASLSFGVGVPIGPPENPTLGKARSARTTLRIVDLTSIYEKRRGFELELFHARMMRAWYDFLERVYTYAVEQYFAGNIATVPTGALNVRVSLDPVLYADTKAALIGSLSESFRFGRTDEQLELVQRALGTRLPEKARETVKKHTVVRNCLEHNRGLIRETDIKPLGGQEITLSDNSAQPKRHGVGDQLTLSIWDIEDLRNALETAANNLIVHV